MHSERVVQPLDTLRFVATAARDCERARARARHLGGSKVARSDQGVGA